MSAGATLSCGGCSGVGVFGVVGAATHDVCSCRARQMASSGQGAGGAAVTNFDLVVVSPAVADFVPCWFGSTPVGGANTGLCCWGRRCCCVWGWYSSGAHLCDGQLDVALVATRLLIVAFF